MLQRVLPRVLLVCCRLFLDEVIAMPWFISCVCKRMCRRCVAVYVAVCVAVCIKRGHSDALVHFVGLFKSVLFAVHVAVCVAVYVAICVAECVAMFVAGRCSVCCSVCCNIFSVCCSKYVLVLAHPKMCACEKESL